MKEKNAFLSLSHAEKLSALLYFLLLFLLPTQLGKHFWPDYSLISGFQVDYLSPTLYLTDILILLLVLSVFRNQKAMGISHLLPYLLALLTLALTILPAVSSGSGLYGFVKVSEMMFFGWYTARMMRSLSHRIIAAWVMLVAVILQSFIALGQIVAKGYIGGLLYYLGERAITSTTPGAAVTSINGEIILRSYGTFSHPNVLAGFLLIGLTFVLLMKEAFRGVIGTICFLVGILFGTLGLFATLSRVSIVLWLLVVGLFLLPHLKRLLSLTLPYRILLGGGLFLLAMLFVLNPLTSNVLGRLSGTSALEESFVVRSDLNTIAVDIIRQNPLLGVGLGNFYFTSITYKDPSDPLYFAIQPVHNIFLLITAEMGFVGLLMFLYLLFLAFLKSNGKGKILLGLLLVLGLTDHYFLTLQQGQLLFAFILGYCFSGVQKLNKSSHEIIPS